MAYLILWINLLLKFLFLGFTNGQYSLIADYEGANFFTHWNFFTANDPTHGYVNYVPQSQAQSENLINTNNGKIYIGCDDTNVASGRGRDSVRICTKNTWLYGLFVLDLNNMPTGCGTWPAWWLVGPNWPNGGEIDIIEGVNTNTQDTTTLHTSEGCDQSAESTSLFSGTWGDGSNGQPATNCWINAPNQYSNQGCGIVGNGNSYGAPFNANGGGVYALEWTTTFIRSFYFTPSNIPPDLTSNSPNPSGWGTPYAYFTLGGSCPDSHFVNQTMVINLTFCGDWAGQVFSTQCPNMGSCNSYVQNNPGDFKNAFWSINYVKVFQQ